MSRVLLTAVTGSETEHALSLRSRGRVRERRTAELDGNAVSSCSHILHWGINQDGEREANALDAQRDGVYTEFEGQISGWMDEAYHTIELNSQLNPNYKISYTDLRRVY